MTVRSEAWRAQRRCRTKYLPDSDVSRGPDLSAAWRAVHGNHDLLDRVVAAFLDECPRLIEDIEVSLTDRDVAAVRRAAHTIQCSMELFGVEPGRTVAARLQKIGRCDGYGVVDMLDALRGEYLRVRRALCGLPQRSDARMADVVPLRGWSDRLTGT